MESMCIVVFAHNVFSNHPLILGANRDEYYSRPSEPLHFWKENPDILGGRDSKRGGTWIAVHRDGRWAALTNFREKKRNPNKKENKKNLKSRGHLVYNFFMENGGIGKYLSQLQNQDHLFPGYNLILGDGNQVGYYSNREQVIRFLEPGFYTLGNELLETPTFKSQRLKLNFMEYLKKFYNPNEPDQKMANGLLSILEDKTPPPKELVPRGNGLPYNLEKKLAAIFVDSLFYGTRVSTLLFLGKQRSSMLECTYPKKKIVRLDFS